MECQSNREPTEFLRETLKAISPRPAPLWFLHFAQNDSTSRITPIMKMLYRENTASKAMKKLEHPGIMRELSGKKRDRIFAYTQYMSMLDEGTRPLSPAALSH